MTYKIECYIETINSEGCFTFHGSEGYCLEKEGKIYNIFWKDIDSSTDTEIQLIAYAQDELKLKAEKQKIFQLFVAAQANHKKILIKMNFENKKNPITKVILL